MTLLYKLSCLFIVLIPSLVAAAGSGEIKKMVFEEQRIEGKIRRPQLVLIKVEQRPEFKPMVLQSLGRNGNIAASVDRRIIDDSPYREPFHFNDMKIDNYLP